MPRRASNMDARNAQSRVLDDDTLILTPHLPSARHFDYPIRRPCDAQAAHRLDVRTLDSSQITNAVMHELADEHRGEGGMELLEAADLERATDFKSSSKFVAGKRSEKIAGRAQLGGQIRESIAQPGSVFTFEHREKFIAYTVALRRRREIGAVGHEARADSFEVGKERGAANSEQRANKTARSHFRHRAQASHPRTAQQPHQDRFRLVAGMMCECDMARAEAIGGAVEKGMTQFAGALLEIGRIEAEAIGALDHKFQSEPTAHIADETLVAIR